MNRNKNNKNVPNKKGTLNVIPLGGMGDVTKNIYVYEYEDDIIVVDCGIGFPEGDLLGVDIVIPDVTYLKKNAHRIKAFLITHGHNDHYSALGYILPQLDGKFPVYASKLVVGFIKNHLKEFNLQRTADIREFDPEGASLTLGSFTVHPFRVNHSVPDAAAFVIETPQQRVVHVSDFKFDWTPMDGKVFDVQKLCEHTKNGVDLLLSDCLGSHKTGFTRSEKDIEHSFDLLMENAKGRVFITATSSNVSRIQQAINSSIRHGRKVALMGRSVRDNVTIAEELGFMEIPDGVLVDSRRTGRIPAHKLTYITAGSYGQKGSALYRIAQGESRFVSIEENDTVIFSGDPSPSGVKDAVDNVVDNLTKLGADVHHYEIQENLHVSGHGAQGDMLMLAQMVKPKYFIPIGGTASTMRGYTKLMERAGYAAKSVFELENGETLVLSGGSARRGKKVRVSDVFVDGLGIGDVGRRVLEERQILSEAGVLVIAATIDNKSGKLVGNVEVTSRGFVFERNSTPLLNKARDIAKKEFMKQDVKGNSTQVRRSVEEKVSRLVMKETQREPIILSVLTSV